VLVECTGDGGVKERDGRKGWTRDVKWILFFSLEFLGDGMMFGERMLRVLDESRPARGDSESKQRD